MPDAVVRTPVFVRTDSRPSTFCSALVSSAHATGLTMADASAPPAIWPKRRREINPEASVTGPILYDMLKTVTG